MHVGSNITSSVHSSPPHFQSSVCPPKVQTVNLIIAIIIFFQFLDLKYSLETHYYHHSIASNNMSNQYTVAEVAKHKDESNGLWIIVDSGVYDITSK